MDHVRLFLEPPRARDDRSPPAQLVSLVRSMPELLAFGCVGKELLPHLAILPFGSVHLNQTG